MSAKSAIKRAVFGASGLLGVQALLRRAHRRRLMVLCYHGVVADEYSGTDPLARHAHRNAVGAAEFDRQMGIVRRKFHPVCADQVVGWVTRGEELPDRAVLVTFDDGYRNNLTNALPILQRHGIPALVSVSTDYIGADRLLWPTEVEMRLGAVARGTEVPDPEGSGSILIAGGEARRVQLDAIRTACKRMPAARLDAYLERLRRETELPEVDEELTAFLNWDEVRALADGGVGIASHTVSHPILTSLAPGALRHELEASKLRIEEELGRECACLVYPNGGREDFSPEVVEAVAAAGYRVAFRLMNSLNPEQSVPPFAIDRVDVPGHVGRSAFDVRVCGLYGRVAGG